MFRKQVNIIANGINSGNGNKFNPDEAELCKLCGYGDMNGMSRNGKGNHGHIGKKAVVFCSRCGGYGSVPIGSQERGVVCAST